MVKCKPNWSPEQFEDYETFSTRTHCKRLGNALFSHTGGGCVLHVFSQGGLPYGAGSKQSGFGPSEKGHHGAGPRDGGKAQRKCAEKDVFIRSFGVDVMSVSMYSKTGKSRKTSSQKALIAVICKKHHIRTDYTSVTDLSETQNLPKPWTQPFIIYCKSC